MKLKFLLLISALTSITAPAHAQEISKVPGARDVQESQNLFQDRLDVMLHAALARPVVSLAAGDFFETVIARIMTNTRIDEVNAGIMHPDTKALGLAGTGFDGVLGACKRKGDYDMQMIDIIPIIYEGSKRGQLTDASYQKILTELLTVKGSEHQTTVSIAGCLRVNETENHILMIESTRYLTNQLWHKQLPNDDEYNNEKNGFNAWLLNHLQQFLKHDFEEYNSRPYQGYSVIPIMNLATYAEDARVKLAATMVLDFLSAKYGVQSSRLRRSAPICRQHETSVATGLLASDHMASMFAILAGNTDIYLANNPSGFITYAGGQAIHTGVTSYRPHALILDMIINNDQVLEQRVTHDGMESYYKHPKYLLTAGGRYLNRFDGNMKKRDGWAYPTSIMPSQGTELDRSQLIRFGGTYDESKRNNMCQFKNFACGMNFAGPSDLPAGCLIEKGEWKFFNYNSPACALKYGYYVAVHVKLYSKPGFLQKRVASDYGTFEVVDADGVNFEEFMAKTMQNNTHLNQHDGVYKTLDGNVIEFNPGHTDLKTNPISKVNGVNPFNESSFLSGNVMTASGDGKIVIKNPKLGLSMILDYRDAQNPVKRIISTEAL